MQWKNPVHVDSYPAHPHEVSVIHEQVHVFSMTQSLCGTANMVKL